MILLGCHRVGVCCVLRQLRFLFVPLLAMVTVTVPDKFLHLDGYSFRGWGDGSVGEIDAMPARGLEPESPGAT